MTKIPSDDILEGLYKLRIRESEKLKTELELYNLEIHQKKAGPTEITKETPWSRIRGQNSVDKELQEIVGNGEAKGRQCSKGDNCSFRYDTHKRAKSTQPSPSPSSSTRQNERNASRTRSPRGKSPSGRMSRWPCKHYLKGTCTNSFCKKWHPPECLVYKTKSGCRFGEKCSYAHRQDDEQPSKRSKKNGDKSAVAMLKSTRQCHQCAWIGYWEMALFVDQRITAKSAFCRRNRGFPQMSPAVKGSRLYGISKLEDQLQN